MRQLSLISILFLYFLLNCIDGSAQQYWDLNGNQINNGNFLGSTNQQDLRFKVNNNPRMVLNHSSGFLGIGGYTTFTPQAHIHANLLSISKNGRLFRTDGHQDTVLTWQMYSGTTLANATQKAKFYLSLILLHKMINGRRICLMNPKTTWVSNPHLETLFLQPMVPIPQPETEQ